VLILKRPWTEQPQGPVEIDWGNPLTRGLVAAFNLSNIAFVENLANNTGGSTTTGGTLTRSVGSLGLCAVSSNGWLSVADATDSMRINSGPLTHVGVCEISAVDANFGGVFSTSDGSNNGSFGLQRKGTSANLYINRGNDSDSTTTVPLADLVASKCWAVASRDSTIGSAFELDVGLTTTQSSTLTAATGSQSGAGIRANFFAERGRNTSFNSDGKYYAHFCWNRYLERAERREILLNPWQLFAPRRIYIPTATAAGGAPTTFTDLKATAITSSSVQATYDYAF
jgi:hypothetical protein